MRKSFGESIPYAGGPCTVLQPYAPDISSCEQYLFCVNDVFETYSCYYGLEWNSNSNECVEPSGSTCEQDTKYFQTAYDRQNIVNIINPNVNIRSPGVNVQTSPQGTISINGNMVAEINGGNSDIISQTNNNIN